MIGELTDIRYTNSYLVTLNRKICTKQKKQYKGRGEYYYTTKLFFHFHADKHKLKTGIYDLSNDKDREQLINIII